MTDRVFFGQEGEPCASCGAALAADQRYCLSCGARRASARLPFMDILAAEAEPAGIVGAGAVIPPRVSASIGDQLRANTGVIAGVGVLLLAMLIGVLVGSGFADDGSTASAVAPRPQVISVGAAPAAAVAPAATTTEAATTPDATPKSPKSDGAAKAPPKATNGDVKKLQGLSGKAYQKQVDKLGKNISTGGKAPPKDKKPAAGGGSFEDIG